jgi:hypothetical protein
MDNKLRSTMTGHADEVITDTIYTHVNDEQVSKAAAQYDPRGGARSVRVDSRLERTLLVFREDNIAPNEKPLTPAAFVSRGAEI